MTVCEMLLCGIVGLVTLIVNRFFEVPIDCLLTLHYIISIFLLMDIRCKLNNKEDK